MWKDIKRGRRRARRRLRSVSLRVDARWVLGAIALAGILAVAALLDRRRTGADVEDLVAYARERRTDPVELITAAGRSNRIVFLGDVHRSTGPKRIAADAIEALARGPGLDAVVLEVAADQQVWIDTYLANEPENGGILFAHPRTLHESHGVGRAFYQIYRRVWGLNRELPPGRRIRIIAADLPGWPPNRRLPPPVAARRYADRDEYMETVIERDVLANDPAARVLIFMGGYHGLKRGGAMLRFAGGDPVRVTWLGARLHARHAGEVFTILPDAPRVPSAEPEVASYSETRAFDVFRRNLAEVTGPFALSVNDRFDALAEPIIEASIPGLDLVLEPEDYTLKELVDGYVWLGRR